MLPDVEGLVAADIVVLMLFGEHRWRIAAPPATVAINTPLSDSHANRRCKKLTEAGLLEVVDERGYYRITQLGLRYINGAVDEKSEIERNLTKTSDSDSDSDD